MKGLSKFQKMDFEGFAKGKQFMSVSVKPWKNYETGEILGTKLESVIVKDKTDYGLSKDGEMISNLFEKITFKVAAEIDVPLNVEIIPINPVAKVYGEYRNQLSVTADDIQVVGK